MNKSNRPYPTYSLTTKGILFQKSGGFTKQKINNKIKNGLFIYGSIIAIFVGTVTMIEFGIRLFDNPPTEKYICCPNECLESE